MRIASILFPLPLPEPFNYQVPDACEIRPGSYVAAPLGPHDRLGVVWNLIESQQDTEDKRPLKTLSQVYDVPAMSAAMRRFIEFCARYNVANKGLVLAMALRARGGHLPSPMQALYRYSRPHEGRLTPARKRLLSIVRSDAPATLGQLTEQAGVSGSVVRSLVKTGTLSQCQAPIDKPFEKPDPERAGPQLTQEQAVAAQQLCQAVHNRAFKPFLLDGVTGSGKTEVYFEAIAACLRSDPDAQLLVLLPEIALTQAVLTRFEERFGSPPAPWHSELSDPQKRRTWREVTHGRARIVVGARSALFLPFRKLSLIIIDEEHDGSYKQEDGVRYHARDMAVMRAHLENAVIILASATPSLETMVNARQGRYTHLSLRARPGTARLPDIELLNLCETPPERGTFLSPGLKSALQETYRTGEQSLLFLNRRGYAPLVICRACGERLKSPGTESWLTEHRYTGRLVCHLTGWSMPKPQACPYCQARDSLMGVGPGVERIAEEVRQCLPAARTAIFSSDTVRGEFSTHQIISDMAEGHIDVLIGTQIVAKGHNFPRLTLVGVVDADSGLKGGDLRAGERTYQLLSQVAGRAGRAERPGRALIQTYQPENPAMQALAHSDRDGYLEIEREARETLGLPPYGRMAALIFSAPDEDMLKAAGLSIGKAAPHGEGVIVYGPAPAPIRVLRGRHRARFLITSPRDVDLSAYMAAWQDSLKLPRPVRVRIDIDPYSFL